MRIIRLIVYLLLLLDLCIFAGYHKILHSTAWSVEQGLVAFLFISLGFVLMVSLYTFFTFRFSDPGKKKDLPLMILVMITIVFVWTNPFDWPLGHRIKLAGTWTGKPTTGKIELYEDGLFEITWNGMARDGKYNGRWERTGDTITLQYIGQKLDRVGDTLLIEDKTMISLNGYSDLILRDVEFTITEANK